MHVVKVQSTAARNKSRKTVFGSTYKQNITKNEICQKWKKYVFTSSLLLVYSLWQELLDAKKYNI